MDFNHQLVHTKRTRSDRKEVVGDGGVDGPTRFSCITEISTIPRGNLGRIRFSYDTFDLPFWGGREGHTSTSTVVEIQAGEIQRVREIAGEKGRLSVIRGKGVT